jgi:tRNA A-37 threonylcarbamoyl transferase component Bud32
MAFEDYVGKKLGNYEIEELVGKGGMAGVFRGYQPSMDRHVAIKIMSQQYSEDEGFVRRFKREAHLIANLEHAHILPVYDFGEEEGVLYIVMRYLPTGDLEERIVPDEGMPLKEAVSLFTQIASALDYAHSRGIIHRDLKPGNVLIDEQGNAFLTDFGIAKEVEGTQSLTGTGGVVGTPTYMSPEQGLGEKIDVRSDVYGLGVMLFEMLTGKQPYMADNPMALMLKHINETPPHPSRVNPNIPMSVSSVILRAMSKDPDSRFSTAGEMAKALQEALATGKMSTIPAAAAADTGGTLPMVSVPGEAATMPAPIPGEPQPATAERGQAAPVAAPVAPPAAVTPPAVPAAPRLGEVTVALNPPSAWLAGREMIGVWLQAVGLSVATFVMLARLVQGGLFEIALLSLVPGILIYGLLGAPTVGALFSMILILVPLVARAPALAIIWLILFVIAGTRLNSREIMLIVVTAVAAGSPLGWLVPLLAPWWLRARRVVLPTALGVAAAMLFAVTLGWPDAGGLLPTPLQNDVRAHVLATPIDTSYLGLFEKGAWGGWEDLDALWKDNVAGTFNALGDFFAITNGLPLLIAAAWAVAATLSVSNRRVQSPYLRPLGLGLGLLVLLAVHLLPGRAGLSRPNVGAIILALFSVGLAFVLSQWPIQADPNRGNQVGTVLRLLRQTLGAFYMALGVAYFSGLLNESSLYWVLWMVGIFGTLTMITNAMIGPPLVFAGLVAAAASAGNPTLTVLTAVMLLVYLFINLFFDRRRPRRWNPLGAGLIVGSPGLAQLGILPLGVLGLGALEAQVPATLLALSGHVLLIATAGSISPLAVIIQLIMTLAGVLVVERAMGVEALHELNHKLLRLILTIGAAVVMAVGYYWLGEVAPGTSVFNAVLLSAVTGAVLVGGMGDRAMYWRRFIEREEEEEEMIEDEEVTGPWERQ